MVKKIKFNKIGKEEIAKEIIKIKGYENIEIEFKVPIKLAASIDLSLEASAEGKGMAVVKFIARHLISWSLPPEPTEENILAIDDVEVLFEFFNVINKRIEKAKN